MTTTHNSNRWGGATRLPPWSLTLLSVLAILAPSHGDEPSRPSELHWSTEREGIRIEATMLDLEVDGPGSALEESDIVRVSFRITDTVSGKPISGLYPAAWMDRIPGGRAGDTSECRDKVQAFLGGGLLAVPEVDLNVYYVLALNDDATITVVDPLFGFGGTKLLELIQLEAPGEDWILTADDRMLFVSMPSIDRLAIISTETWETVRTIDVGGRPVEIDLQPDERFLWIATEADHPVIGGSGVTVVDTQTGEIAGHIATGAGPHHLAFADDGRFAFVTNGRAGSVTVVDVVTRKIVDTTQLGGRPNAIDWSTAAQAAYLSIDEGRIVAVDTGAKKIATIEQSLEPGLGRLRFAPDGRYAFVVNPAMNTVHVVDASSNRVIQTGDVEATPDQIAFSDDLAYIHHAGSEIVLMVPLDALEPGMPLQVIDFPGGESFPGDGGIPSPADAIVQAPGASAVLVSNPVDGVIYYYKIGMAAPMGTFQNYGRQPRAVEVVDRSLEEGLPGVYQTSVKLRRPGDYDLAFFLDAPQQVSCFDFDVRPNQALERERVAGTLAIELLGGEQPLTVGTPVTLRFRVRDPLDPNVRVDDSELRALLFRAPGLWQRRLTPARNAEGDYEIEFTPSSEGLYYVYFESPAVGMKLNRSPGFIFEAQASTDITEVQP